MLSPNEREKNAFKMIANSTEGAEFVDFLNRNLLAEDESNRQKEGVQLSRGQGAALLLDELIKLVKQ